VKRKSRGKLSEAKGSLWKLDSCESCESVVVVVVVDVVVVDVVGNRLLVSRKCRGKLSTAGFNI